MLELDNTWYGQTVAGTDEAGRGPLCGPVYAAAVVLHPDRPIMELNDSKKLSAARRMVLFDVIQRDALAWSIAACTAKEIDQYNILQASLMAMVRAVAGLNVQPDHVLVDGNRLPRTLLLPATAVVKGDGRHSAIAAASILAKVARDRYMGDLDVQFPHYGLVRNQGYPTPEHLTALQIHGICPEHRRSFAPVRSVISQAAENHPVMASDTQAKDLQESFDI
ncbi:MAG: ribonuclease HII [Natronospirillum sp.]